MVLEAGGGRYGGRDRWEEVWQERPREEGWRSRGVYRNRPLAKSGRT